MKAVYKVKAGKIHTQMGYSLRLQRGNRRCRNMQALRPLGLTQAKPWGTLLGLEIFAPKSSSSTELEVLLAGHFYSLPP